MASLSRKKWSMHLPCIHILKMASTLSTWVNLIGGKMKIVLISLFLNSFVLIFLPDGALSYQHSKYIPTQGPNPSPRGPATTAMISQLT